MADPADTAAATHDATGQGTGAGVDVSGNDAFSNAFAAFAAGNPAPEIEDEDEDRDDLDAGQGEADEGADKAPSERDDTDPPANAPADAAAGNEDPDPWANATPAQKAALDKMREDYERKLQGASGRASGLQRQLNALKTGTTAATAPQNTGQDGKGDEPSDAWKVLDDKIKALEEDYPEIAGVIVPLLKQQRDELANVKGQMAPVIEADQAEVVAAQQSALEAKHPDWRNYAPGANADFDGWINAQPENVQRLAGSWDAREVGVALTLFKTEQAEAKRQGNQQDPAPKDKTATDARRQRQLDGGKVVGSRTAPAAAGAPDDFAGAFDHFAKKIDAKK